MGQRLCVLHANCQGDALKQLLEASPDFSRQFHIRHLRNYLQEDLDQGILDECGLFLHQYLAWKWGSISTGEVLKRLPAATAKLCVPNCFFQGYWPNWVHKPEVMDFADEFLETLIEQNIEKKALLKLYLDANPALAGDVEAIALRSLEIEKTKEQHSPIKYVAWMEERWRRQQIFLTINHPGTDLLVHVAQEILKYLGFKPIPEAYIKNFQHPHNEFWLPIHPVYGQRLGLSFADKDRRYPCFGADLTHLEYTLCYLACREHNFKDLPSALAACGKTALLHKSGHDLKMSNKSM